MTALQYFRMFAAEFATMADNLVQPWLDLALCRMNAGCLSVDKQAQAQALLAAHLLKLSQMAASGSGAVGQIISEKEGDLSRTYAAPAKNRGSIDGTGYGSQYADLTAPCSGLAIMTRIG
jgi:hypothetical protein